jgi:hypothetical protein
MKQFFLTVILPPIIVMTIVFVVAWVADKVGPWIDWH